MVRCTRVRQADGRMVMWERPVSGDPMAPYDNALANMDKILFHSDWRYLNVLARVNGIAVAHAQVNGTTGAGYAPPSAAGATTGAVSSGQIVTTTKLLYAHGQSYRPKFFVLLGSTILTQGSVVQITADKGRARFVSPYVTATEIRLKEIGISSDQALPAVNLSYDVIVFKEPVAVPGAPLFHLDPDASPAASIGYGKITSNDRPVRRATLGGDVALRLPDGRTADVKNGALRNILNGVTRDLGQYNGSFFTANTIEVTY